MHEFFWKHDVGVKIALLILVLLLALNVILINNSFYHSAQASQDERGFLGFPQIATIDSCGEKCKKIIDEKIAAAVATLSAKPTPVAASPTKNQSVSQVNYIPLGGSLTTQSTSWTDVGDSDVWVDKADFGSNPVITWDASLKVGNANGKTFARLYDVTHGIGVSGSEVSVSDQASWTFVSSGALQFWNGRNLYRVQVKSLNNSDASYSNGRIKVTVR